jgi:hypothetical protein
MPATSSPRTRRRLFWLAGIVAVLAIGAGVIALLPSQGGSGARTFDRSAPGNPFGTTTGPSAQQEAADAAAARAASRAVRPLAESFMADVVLRKNLAQAHALLGPKLRAKNALSDWKAGDHLPVSVDPQKQYSISTVLSFAGATSAGFVSEVDEEPSVSPETKLVAVRFAKQRGHWLVDYINQGHSSGLVDQSNYAPAGFLPGSHGQSTKDWAILILGFLAVVAVVVLLDRLLGGSRSSTRV